MSSDDELGVFPAFQIENTEYELDDLSVPPTSGQEYLRRVQMEAKNCPSIVVADVDTASFNKQQTVRVLPNAGYQPAPEGYAPNRAWQRKQVHDFSLLRQKILRHKAMNKKNGIKAKQRLPLPEDVTGWCAMCFGPLNVQRNPQVSTPDGATGSEEHLRRIGLDPAATCGSPPLLSILTFMDQSTVVQVLEYHVNWFEATGFTTQQGRWFFALLTCLEKPLLPEACSLIRSLARLCTNLRASMDDPDNSMVTQLNLLICLVARYFGQTDLADNT